MTARGLDDAARSELRALARTLGVPASWPLAMLYLESRITPGLIAPTGCGGKGCAGMSMMAFDELRRRNIDPSNYVTWSAAKQLHDVIGPWYVDTLHRYLGKTPRSVGTFYALNLAPGRLLQSGDAPDVVLYAAPDPRYTGNAGLDADKDGRITIADLDVYMTKLMRDPPFVAEAKALGEEPAPPTDKGGKSFTGALLLALAIGVILAKSKGIGS